ncbi:MAG: hypothetical protein ACRBK7_25180, partial [Acidimicrobiales bacterium]
GCYVLTYIAPADRTFVESGTAWYNQPLCVQPDENALHQQARLFAAEATGVAAQIEGLFFAVSEVSADLFTDDGSGGRGEYLKSAATDVDGMVVLPADPGCYVATFVAPADYTWEQSGTQWLNVPACVELGQLTDVGPLQLDQDVSPSIRFDLLVSKEGTFAVGGVQVDFFRADADGNRGEFVDSGTTIGRNRSRFIIDPGRGCWVVTLVAPADELFEQNDREWLNIPFCTTPDQDVYSFDVLLATPTGNEVQLNLSEAPHQVSGEVTADQPSDYRISGTPGALVALEVHPTDALSCEPFEQPTLVIKTDDEVVEHIGDPRCDLHGPWAIPDSGSLVVGVRLPTNGGDVEPYSLVIGEVVYEDVAFPPLSADSAQTRSGAISSPGDGIDYVTSGPPGQLVTLQMATEGCSYLSLSVLDSTEEPIVEPRSCRISSPVEIPDDGVLIIRVKHDRLLLTLDPEAQSYTLSARLVEHEQVPVPNDQGELEISGSIDYLHDGTDYIFDTSGIDELSVQIIENDGAGGCVDNELYGSYRSGDLGLVGGLSCTADRPVDVSEYDTVTLEVRGPIGPYRLLANRVSHDAIPLDLTAEPIEVSGSVDRPFERVVYRITAPAGSYISAANLDVDEFGYCSGDGFRFGFDAFDSNGDGVFVPEISGCERDGPWPIPSDGILDLHVRGYSLTETGAFALKLASFFYDEVAVDLSDGSFEVNEAIDIALDGTDYIITGSPGDEFAIEVTDMSPGDCDAETQIFRLRLDILNAQGEEVATEDAGYNGCLVYGPWILDQAGQLTVRAYTNGSGETYQGSYSMRIFSTR